MITIVLFHHDAFVVVDQLEFLNAQIFGLFVPQPAELLNKLWFSLLELFEVMLTSMKSFFDGLDFLDVLVTSLQLRIERSIAWISTIYHVSQITLAQLIDCLIGMSMWNNQ